MHFNNRWGGNVFLTLLILLSLVVPAGAATITVTNTNDNGSGSLRQAILDADPGDLIEFAVTGAITLTTGELLIEKNLTITGPGADLLTVSGDHSSCVFHIKNETVVISDLTVADGNSAVYASGILNDKGDMTLTRCTVSGNDTGGNGGGVYNESGRMTLTHCTISGNTAVWHGGGVLNDKGDMTLTRCTISGNTAGWLGGGVSNYKGGMALVNCTVSGNHANDGGGIDSESGNLILTNCTVGGNIAGNEGGGICNYESVFDCKNTIIADNIAVTGGPDFYGDLDSHGYNLIEDTADCSIINIENPGTDITGQDPRLGPLSDNGGATRTHAIPAESPAVDAASCSDMEGNDMTEDQRGVGRPQMNSCDIGAYECHSPQVPVPTVSGCGVVALAGVLGVIGVLRVRTSRKTRGPQDDPV